MGRHRVLIMCPAAEWYIIGWVVAGEGYKILIKVGLIVITALVRNLRPIDRLYGINRVENVFKPDEAGQFFWRDADQPFELVAQVILANPDMIAQRANRQHAMILHHLSNSILGDTQPIWRFTKTSK